MVLLHFPGSGQAFIVTTTFLLVFIFLMFILKIKLESRSKSRVYLNLISNIGITLLFLLIIFSSFISLISLLTYTSYTDSSYLLPIYIFTLMLTIWTYKHYIKIKKKLD